MILAVLQLRSFHFDNEVWDRWPVNIHHNNIGPFRCVPPKSDRIFDLDSVERVVVLPMEATKPKLPHKFFRFGGPVLA